MAELGGSRTVPPLILLYSSDTQRSIQTGNQGSEQGICSPMPHDSGALVREPFGSCFLPSPQRAL